MAKKHVWKTKIDPNDDKSKFIECMNSNLQISKWAEYYENDEPCEEWVKVDKDSTAALCWKCTGMTVR